MSYKHLLPACILCLAAFSGSAQSARLRLAAEAMRDLDYVTAIAEYQQILQQAEVAEAKINLAECYRKVNDTENAEYWYGQVVSLPQAKPAHWLYYGMMLQANGKCDLAKEWYLRYAQAMPDDARGQNLAQACENANDLLTRNTEVYAVGYLPFNSNRDDYSPALRDSLLIFASDRDDGNAAAHRINMWTGSAFTALYGVHYQPAAGADPSRYWYGRTNKYAPSLDARYHEAAVAFSPDGRTIYYTRNDAGEDAGGLHKMKIYAASADGRGGWIDLRALPFNSNEYNVMHPTLSPDGQRIYFSSNMPGGYGGMDLYYSEGKNGRWGPPVNLGPAVNTEGHEAFPFVDKNNRLYFASDSHVGLGGLDIYYTSETGPNAWSTPVNLGYPINSTYDDFGIVLGPGLNWGYFASDRPGGAGRSDIYSFQKIAAPVEVLVYDAQTKAPLPDVTVLNSLSGASLTTGANGRITLDMRLNECADFSAAKVGYTPAIRQGCTRDLPSGQVLSVEIPLQKQVNFALQGIVFDMTDGLPAEGARVELMNDCGLPAAPPFYTAADGRYHFRLDGGCCYTVKAVKEGFIAGLSEGLCAKGLAPDAALQSNLNLQPFNANLSAQARARAAAANGNSPAQPKTPLPKYNDRTGRYENAEGQPADYDFGNGLTVRAGVLYDKDQPTQPLANEWTKTATGEGFLLKIYYDYDQAALREESLPQLKKLLQLLLENPDLKAELSSHTDSRGADDYNLDLSQRRADAVVAWLAERGIPRSRLVGKGYGEMQPVNRCSNGVECTEEEHQQNRRTEFRVIGAPGMGRGGVSQPEKKAGCVGCPF